MISIIISKYHPTQVELLRQNIEDTIGVPFEMIVIENSRGEMGLCEVYNKGAEMARYDILCYSHEDIEIQSMDWGKKALSLFEKDERLGLLGLAGAGFKSWSPSGWWHPYANPKTLFSHYIQSDRSREKTYMQRSQPGEETLPSAVCVDGFWFCTRKRIALELRFDDETFKGFHCYDVDYSLKVFQRYKVAVTYEIIIKHFSEGSGFKAWVEETLKLYRKWEAKLPFDSVRLNQEEQRAEEIRAFDYFLYVMIENGFPMRRVCGLLWSAKARRVLGFKGYLLLNGKIVYRGLRRALTRGNLK